VKTGLNFQQESAENSLVFWQKTSKALLKKAVTPGTYIAVL
jgi:hypothetical protein